MANNSTADGAELGERVIPGSRRPDGTMRKEIRIRAGYIPQDEVEKYVAYGTRPKSDGPELPPGLDPEYAAAQMALKKKAGSKNANKNAKRKEKKAAAATAAATTTHESAPPDVAKTAEKLSKVKLQESPAETSSGPASQGAPAEEGQSLEKQLRNLRKKIRQAESLEASVTSRGESASQEELDKINRLSALREEAVQLEKQISGS